MNSTYFYNLPAEKIALFPVSGRTESKLLVWRNNSISDKLFSDLPFLLPAHCHLVRNITKVIKARLFLQRESGGLYEFFCLESFSTAKGSSVVKCLIRNMKRIRTGEIFQSTREFSQQTATLTAQIGERIEDYAHVHFSWDCPELSFHDILDIFGTSPLPPYIRREADEKDAERYQTTFATEKGSVAAPTAGLHFTPELDHKLIERGVSISDINLHVGLGTFQPMKTDNLYDHSMHSEKFSVSIDTIHELFTNKNPLISVGTTTLRTLESLYIAAHFPDKLSDPENILVDQWDHREIKKKMKRAEAWQRILESSDNKRITKFSGSTQLMITPDYKCETTDLLITNFHQPNSTLLLIVASMTGDTWKDIYNHALNSNYRFLSYGDACLIENQKANF